MVASRSPSRRVYVLLSIKRAYNTENISSDVLVCMTSQSSRSKPRTPLESNKSAISAEKKGNKRHVCRNSRSSRSKEGRRLEHCLCGAELHIRLYHRLANILDCCKSQRNLQLLENLEGLLNRCSVLQLRSTCLAVCSSQKFEDNVSEPLCEE